MHPIRGHLRQWHKDERAILQTGVWKDQFAGHFYFLSLCGQIAPKCLNFDVRKYCAPERNQIQIKRARSPAHIARPVRLCLNFMHQSKQIIRRHRGPYRHGSIHKIRPDPGRKSGGRIQTAEFIGIKIQQFY